MPRRFRKPHASQISQSGLLFFNMLFNKNAARRIAIGTPDPRFLRCIGERTAGERVACRFSDSRVHREWIIGSGEGDVDCVAPNPLHSH